MDIQDLKYAHFCYRCGELLPEFDIDESTGKRVCKHCGESSVVTVREASDILNDMHLKELFKIDAMEDAWDAEMAEVIYSVEDKT